MDPAGFTLSGFAFPVRPPRAVAGFTLSGFAFPVFPADRGQVARWAVPAHAGAWAVPAHAGA